MVSLAPPCPACGKSVPFWKTQWGLGKPFPCKGCGTTLVVPNNFWIAMSAIIMFWTWKNRMASPFETVMLIAGLAIAILILSRLFLRPMKA
jgi:hypothetical protein